MKRFLTPICFVLAFLALSLPIAAESAETLPPEIAGGYETMLDAIPEDILDELPEGLLSGNEAEIGEAVETMLDVSYIAQMLLEAIGLYLDDGIRLFALLCGILLLSSVFSAVRKSLRANALARVISTVASLAILLAVAETQTALFLQLEEYFSSLSALAGGMIPVSGMLYAMGGNVAGAATGSAAMSVFLAICECIGGKLLFPTVGACMALATVPVFAPGVNVRSLSSCIKKTFTFCLGFLMMLLSALLAMRSGLAAKADSISARTVKYVTSSVIPVVGGSIADSLRTVGASVEYLRTTLGIAGILLIVFLLLPVLVNVLLTRLALIFAAAAAELLGCDGEARLLSELVSVYGYVLAVAVMCAVMFVFALTLLVRTAVAI